MEALAEFSLSLRRRGAILTIGVEFSCSMRSTVDMFVVSMRVLNSSFGTAWITMPYFGLRTERPLNAVSQLICRSCLACSSVLHRNRILSGAVLLLLKYSEDGGFILVMDIGVNHALQRFSNGFWGHCGYAASGRFRC